MKSETNDYLASRVRLLLETMPTAARKRTDGARLMTCKDLTEHLRRAHQLEAYAVTGSDQELVASLISDIQVRRDELSSGGQLAARVRARRGGRPDPAELLAAWNNFQANARRTTRLRAQAEISKVNTAILERIEQGNRP